MTDKRLHYLTIVCFHILLVFVPVYFRFTTEELFEFNKLLVVYALTAVIGGLWVSRMIVRGAVLWRRTPFDIPLAMFLGTQILATLFSMHPRTSWFGYYTRFHGGLLSYFAYTVLYYAAVNTFQKSHIKPLLLSALGSASLVSLYGILEHFGHSPSCLLITNGAAFDASCWIQDVQSRVFATFGQPNWLAAYAITLWPVAAWVTLEKSSSPKLRAFGLSAWVLLSLVLAYTKSRSGFLGLAVGLGILGGMRVGSWVWGRKSEKSLLAGMHSQFAMVSSALLLALFIYVGTPFSPALSTLFAPTPESTTGSTPAPAVDRLEAGGTDSGEIRKIVWSGAVEIWKRYPLLGSGVETFAYSYYRDRPIEHNLVSEWDFLYNKAHNEVLNFFATTGVLGGTSYLLLVGWFFLVAWRIAASGSNPPREQLLAISLSAGVGALFVSNFFGFSTVMVTALWFLFMSFLSVLSQGEEPEHRPSAITSTTWFGLGITWFAVVVSLVLVYRMYAADTAYALGKSLLSSGDFLAGSQQLQRAISFSPKEALYYDELGHHMARAAVDVAAADDASGASRLASTAVVLSDTALTLNPTHLNFFKTRARIFITLAQLKPELLENAKEALLAGIERSPTDAKLVYNLALVEMGLENSDESIAQLEKAVELKPNYGAARLELAKAYMNSDATASAKVQLEYILQYINPEDTQSAQLLAEIATASGELESK